MIVSTSDTTKMSTFKRIVHKVELPPPEGCVTSIDRQLAGEDLLPVPPHKRQWKAISFVNFWIADSFNGEPLHPRLDEGLLIHLLVNTFAIASSGIVAGLSWWQALIATALGYSMAAPFLCLNGRPGAVHHIKFPAVARASFGIWLSTWIVIQRVCMSIVWWSGELRISSANAVPLIAMDSAIVDRRTMCCGTSQGHLSLIRSTQEHHVCQSGSSYHPE